MTKAIIATMVKKFLSGFVSLATDLFSFLSTCLLGMIEKLFKDSSKFKEYILTFQFYSNSLIKPGFES